jgi:hypothetical protein
MKFAIASSALSVLLVSPLIAAAGTINTGDRVVVLNTQGTLGGGPFAMDGPDGDIGLSDALRTDFLSFCLEIDEHIYLDTGYYAKVSNAAEYGGAGGPSPDPLDEKTAYLYSKFLNGTLAGFNLGNADDRDGLQLAIWRLEEEVYRTGTGKYKNAATNVTLGNSATNVPKFLKADLYYDDAVANALPGNFYGIGVMQLWGSYNKLTGNFSGNKQDQLIPLSVPESTSTLATLLIGIAVIATARGRLAS